MGKKGGAYTWLMLVPLRIDQIEYVKNQEDKCNQEMTSAEKREQTAHMNTLLNH